MIAKDYVCLSGMRRCGKALFQKTYCCIDVLILRRTHKVNQSFQTNESDCNISFVSLHKKRHAVVRELCL
jgi:hypothetical protein